MRPTLVHDVRKWRKIRNSEPMASHSIGFVPTMGNLHAGHESLLVRSRQENQISVMSIFVNATQFDDPGDLARYPKTLEEDIVKAEKIGTDYILLPTFDQIYPDGYRFRVSESQLSRRLCGRHRPGHFDGVLTVVLKLLMLVRPHSAYFGEKDYQQYLLVRDMAAAFFLETRIVPCPIVRDEDGLALSSRNNLLSESQRSLAQRFPQLLRRPGSTEETLHLLEEAGFVVDYVEDFENRRFAAVRVGEVRLIDNVPTPGPN